MSKADNIIQQQRDLQKELDKIQSDCKHTKETIKQLPDKNEWWWQCTACNKNTRYATQTEIIEYISK
jgi:hypothetical protein